jgi:hypothetical protein
MVDFTPFGGTTMRETNWLWRRLWLAVAVFIAVTLASVPGQAFSQELADDAVTFARDVAPILQENCQECHRAQGIAPMSLLTYEEARRYATRIKHQVTARQMPPWPIDRTIGIQEFKNDRSLSDEEVRIIGRWVDSGAPLGDPGDMPPPIAWPSHADFWNYQERFGRPPDLVVSSPAYRVPANSADHWPNLRSTVEGISEDRWVRAGEFKAADPETWMVIHHANPSFGTPGDMDGSLRQVRGSEGMIFPEGTGQPIHPNDIVQWGMHLYGSETDVDAVLELGLWLYPEGYTPEHRASYSMEFNNSQFTGHGFDSNPALGFGPNVKGEPGEWGSGGNPGGHSVDPQIARQADLIIPPHSVVTYRGVYVLPKPARMESFRAHMHLRGVYQILEAIYPDGRWEVINKAHNSHVWQTDFIYEDHAAPLFPKGTVLIVTGVYDNTVNNPSNPDPHQWVTRGSRTVDEMGHLRNGLHFFDNEEEFATAVREREAFVRGRQLLTQEASIR